MVFVTNCPVPNFPLPNCSVTNCPNIKDNLILGNLLPNNSVKENLVKDNCSVLKLEKMPQKRMECFRLLFDHLAWIEHQFLSGTRYSRKAGSLWGMMGGVGGVRKSILHSWLAKGLGLGLLCWGFKGVQEEIPSEDASTLQIGSVAFPQGQCTSQQLHPCPRLFDESGNQHCSLPSL